MKITRPRAIDFFVLATGLFSFCASSRVSLAGASPLTSSAAPSVRRAIAVHLRNSTLLPIRGKDIEFVRQLRALVGSEHNRLPIRRELGERRKPSEIRHLLQVRPVRVDQIQFKLPPIAIVLVGGEQNLFTIRGKSR